jgi:hypothetical protein
MEVMKKLKIPTLAIVENMAYVRPPLPLRAQVDAFVAKHELGASAREDLQELLTSAPKMFPFGQGALAKILEISGPEVPFKFVPT